MRRTIVGCAIFASLAATSAAQVKPQIFDVRLLLASPVQWCGEARDWRVRLERLTELADAAVRLEQKEASVTSEETGYLIVRGTGAQDSGVAQMLIDVRKSLVRPTQLQLSLLRMPATLAASSGLQDGKPKDVTPDEMTVLLREVQKARGTLANLPEVRTRTLQGFEAKVPEPAAAAARPTTSLVASGQVLPFGDRAALHFDLTAVLLKDGEAVAEKKLLWSTVTAVELGKGVLVTRIQGDEATCLWVSLIAMGEKEPANGEASAVKGK
jgi:hypothetical protein